MKRWTVLGALLVVLACLVPYSSKRPDAVQGVLGLPGGVDSALKALGGILAAAGMLMLIVFSLRKLGGKE